MCLTVPYIRWLSLTVLPSAIELLHISHCLLWLLALSHCLYQCHGVAQPLSFCPMVGGCLSLSL